MKPVTELFFEMYGSAINQLKTQKPWLGSTYLTDEDQRIYPPGTTKYFVITTFILGSAYFAEDGTCIAFVIKPQKVQVFCKWTQKKSSTGNQND